MTRLISNRTRSSRAASADGGVGEVSTEVAAVLTDLPGRADPRHLRSCRRGGRRPPLLPVSYTWRVEPPSSCGAMPTHRRSWESIGDRAAPTARSGDRLLAWSVRRAAPPVAARRLYVQAR